MAVIQNQTSAKPILFLLEQEFEDPQHRGQRFFCPHSLLLEGALVSVAGLRERLEVRHVRFPRPRQEVIGVIGEGDQSLPKLVLPAELRSAHASGEHGARQYVSGTDRILATLGELYGIPQPHP